MKNKEDIKFAKKEKTQIPGAILSDMNIIIPPIYYWEDVVNDVSEMMTMAFKFNGKNFGMTYPIENIKETDALRSKLFNIVKESLDVMIHHGEKILDSSGEVDMKKINYEEALRFKYDANWLQKIAAFNKLVRIDPITKEKALTLGLLDKIKVI